MTLLSRTARALALAMLLAVGSAGLAPTAAAALTPIYTNDFSVAPGAEWTGFNTVGTTPNVACGECGSFLGPFGFGASTLSLASLGPHTTVNVTFDLFLLESWDGQGNLGAGPDVWRFTADGTVRFDHQMAVYPGQLQNYPAPNSPTDTNAAATDTLGYTTYGDAVYKLSFEFAHSAPTLTLLFEGLAAEGWPNEGWGIDDLVVRADVSAPPTCNTTLLADTFDTENAGTGVLNHAAWANFGVTDGSVDLIGNGFFDFYPTNGLYVDLDGSTGNAGVFASAPLSLPAGDVIVTFELGGSARGDSNVVTVALGSLYAEDFTLASSDPLALVTRVVTVPAPTSASLSFSNAGGDNIGAILDDVGVCAAGEVIVDPPVCALGHGFWKNNPDAWPVDSLVLGGETYTKDQLLTILKTPVGTGKRADASLILAYQLIATNLSVAMGADGSVVQSEVDNATALLMPLDRIPTGTHPSTPTGQAMVQNASKLDQFVNGLLTEGCHTDVQLTKTGPASAANGEAVTFTLNVTNLAWVPAKGVVVTDTLPAGWTYVSNDAGCTVSGQVVTCNLGDIASRGSVEFHIVATAVGCGVHTNAASVTSTSEPAGHDANNADSADVDVTGCA